MQNLSPTLTVMIQAARKAARGLKRDFGEIEKLQVSVKGPADFVSTADHRSEKILREELSRARPGYGFLMEETGSIEGSDKTHRWIIDPLDGTTNFLHGIPLFAVSIALERAGRVVAGVVYNPVTDEMFYTERGKGAFLDNSRIRVAARRDLGNAVFTTGVPHRARPGHVPFLQELEALMPQVAGIRRTGSAALDTCYVAAGRFDGYWESHLNAWDLAAGLAILLEAGGQASDMNGGPAILETGSIVASNTTLHRPLLAALRKARTTPTAETGGAPNT